MVQKRSGRTGQRLRISLISTRSPQPIHRVTEVERRPGRAGACRPDCKIGRTLRFFQVSKACFKETKPLAGNVTRSAGMEPVTKEVTSKTEMKTVAGNENSGAGMEPMARDVTSSAKMNPLARNETSGAGTEPATRDVTSSAEMKPLAGNETSGEDIESMAREVTSRAETKPLVGNVTSGAGKEPVAEEVASEANLEPETAKSISADTRSLVPVKRSALLTQLYISTNHSTLLGQFNKADEVHIGTYNATMATTSRSLLSPASPSFRELSLLCIIPIKAESLSIGSRQTRSKYAGSASAGSGPAKLAPAGLGSMSAETVSAGSGSARLGSAWLPSAESLPVGPEAASSVSANQAKACRVGSRQNNVSRSSICRARIKGSRVKIR
jgi:hypothetical protein